MLTCSFTTASRKWDVNGICVCAFPVCDDGGFKLRSMMRSKGNLVVNRAQEGILVGMQKLRE